MLGRKHGKVHSFFNINTRRTCKWQDIKIYQVKFIGSVKYMVSSLSNVVHNLPKGRYKGK